MLDMSKLPSHKIENGIVIFDEPYVIGDVNDLFDFMHTILHCDFLINDNEPTVRIFAFASTPDYNSNLYDMFINNLDKGWSCVSGATEHQVVLPV